MEEKKKRTPEELKQWQKENGERFKHNLIPITERTPEEALEIRRKAQRGMMEAKKKKKTIRDVMDMITALDANGIAKDYVNPDIIDKVKEAGENITLYDLIGLAQAQKAIEGSAKSAEFIRDSAGDAPKNQTDINIDIVTDSDRAMLQNISDRLASLEAIDAEKSH